MLTVIIDTSAAMTDAKLYLSAKEAASLLGISVNTLYAYVSRKGIRTRSVPDRKGSLYWGEDIRRLAATPDHTTNRTLVGNLVETTAVTLLTSEGPFYRGKSALFLAKSATFEETAALLWGADPAIFEQPLHPLPPTFGDARKAVAHLTTIDQLISLLPLFEQASPKNYDLSPEGYHASGVHLLRLFAALLAKVAEPVIQPIHELIAVSRGAGELSDVVRQLLVLMADHELAPSTYVVRAAANIGTTPFQAVIAGLSSARGRRVTAAKSYTIRQFIEEMLSDSDPERAIVRRVRHGEPLPGFSDGIYRGRDTRADFLLNSLRDQHGNRPSVAALLRAVELARTVAGVMPDIVIPFMFIERELGVSHDDGAIGWLGRVAGWLAHASEQYQTGHMVRFEAAYVGELPETEY